MKYFYEFFAGGGMARTGLGVRWRCLFANDIDRKKASIYSDNWGHSELFIEDISALTTMQLPGGADLAWASFPCQDLSLAGSGAGLRGKRSGTFWPFWSLIQALSNEGRAPPVVVLENVSGALTSHEGRDFAVISEAIAREGYRFGALVIDAVRSPIWPALSASGRFDPESGAHCGRRRSASNIWPRRGCKTLRKTVSRNENRARAPGGPPPDDAGGQGRDTGPEMVVRRLAHGMGYRYRLHGKDLPGKPDLVFRPRRKAIFVHGCFWHQHDCPRGARLPKANRGYWLPKLRRNRERDAEHRARLRDMGWEVLTIWECETRDRDALARKVAAFLDCGGAPPQAA